MKNSGTIRIINLIVVLTTALLFSLKPPYPDQMLLQHSATILAFILLVIDWRKKYFSYFAVFCFSLFIILHIIGARWIYSYVPYNDWFKNLFNFDINETFSFSRNHYDRFVHFAYGILFFPIMFEIISGKLKTTKGISVLITWLFIQFFSLFYELFEWSLTFFLASEDVANYNGQQGDIWDAHKDMVLAMLGSTLILFRYLKRNNKSGEKNNN